MSKLFPRRSNSFPLKLGVYVVVLAVTVTAGIAYYCTPKYLRVGYAPVQPVLYDHSLHAGQLGLDCRYCHGIVEKSGWANFPTAQTCMNCHQLVKPQSPLLAVVRAIASGEIAEPAPWVKVHQAPDYVFFNHAIHVNRGINCVECHGRVDEMPVVTHAESLSMDFCLTCHRDPAQYLRAPAQVYDLNAPTLAAQGRRAEAVKLIEVWKVKPMQSCSGCHR